MCFTISDYPVCWSLFRSSLLLFALNAVERTIEDKTRFHYYDESDEIKRRKIKSDDLVFELP